MATSENNVLLTYKDQSGKLYLLYPVTKAEQVDGLDEAMATRFTDEEKNKLAGIEAGANKFVLGDGAVTAAKIASNAVSKSFTVTLAVASWSSKKQTVTASGVTTSNTVIVTPAPASFFAYGEAQVRCTAQAANSLTFQCETVPTAALTVNVTYINK